LKVKRLRSKVSLILIVILVVALAIALFPLSASAAGHTAEEAAIERVREAIRALPEASTITGDYRAAVIEARRLMDATMAQYGLTEYDICILSAKLAVIEARLGTRTPAAPVELPPTGGSALIPLGLAAMLAGAAILKPRNK
jgi:hypothetical protein